MMYLKKVSLVLFKYIKHINTCLKLFDGMTENCFLSLFLINNNVDIRTRRLRYDFNEFICYVFNYVREIKRYVIEDSQYLF